MADRPGPLTLSAIEAAVRAAFSRELCSPDDLADWTPGNPSRGHCAVTALTLHDLLGGDLLVAEVTRGGERTGYHSWNRIGGVEVDLTREQFAPDEVVGEPEVVHRPPGLPGPYTDQYLEMRRRVGAALGVEIPGRDAAG